MKEIAYPGLGFGLPSCSFLQIPADNSLKRLCGERSGEILHVQVSARAARMSGHLLNNRVTVADMIPRLVPIANA